MRTITVIFAWFLVSMPAFATGIEALSDDDAADGLKQALTQGVNAAVDRLGVANGFLDNPKVKIPLPGTLQKVEGVMRTLGASKHVDGLIVTMNRVAEVAAAEARTLMLDTVEKLPVENARKILTGGDDAATRYFRATASEELAQEFLPIVKNATNQVDLAKKYNDFARKGGKFGLIAEKYANIEGYVTQKTLDGLYLMMAEEERLIRNEPMGQDNKVLQKVFGSLK
ncbi:DUF4197 domain-containing protein [Nitrosospira sp. Nsp13]|uniref:DUF4197 domain-containing protein n=1 Tax=Nitrosospira sp. Nsp13 TaxID=1855332 RepID=UPI000891BBBE|nr:DUF4197 domain-containing protein [Nitrosospira sp. Nsp13]SCY03539.1 Protein of unknown function [Nitrosospira sp. Nsp13]